MRTIAVANQKGGCGKTTTAINLAATLAQTGNRVLIVDLDPQACTTLALNGEPDADRATVYYLFVDRPAVLSDVAIHTEVERLDLAPSNMLLAGAELELTGRSGGELRLARAFATVRDKYDLCVIDCPPSLGALTLNALVASTDVIVPVHMDPYALECTKRLLQTVAFVRQKFSRHCAGNLKILLTCVDDESVLGRQVRQQTQQLFGDLAFRTVIHRTTTLSEAMGAGKAAITYAPASKGAAEYRRLAEELLGCEQEPEQMPALAEVALIAQGALSQRRVELRRSSITAASGVSRDLREKRESPGPQTGRAREEPQVPKRNAPDCGKPPVPNAETPAADATEMPPRGPPEGPRGTAPGSSKPAASEACEPEPKWAVSHLEYRWRRARNTLPSRVRKIVLCLALVAVLVAAVITAVLAVRGEPPTANPGSAAAQEDTPLSIRLTGADQDPLTYRIVRGPAHGRLSGSPPDVVYTPTLNYQGSDDFTFVANDGTRDSAPATLSILVAATNDAPTITSVPVTAAATGRQYTYDVNAIDPDEGDDLTYSLIEKPAGMSVNPTTGRIEWTPTSDQAGRHHVVVKVTDSSATPALDTQSFFVAVGPPSLQKVTLAASGGYDQRSRKTLSINGDIRKVRAIDDTSLETQAGFYTVYSFSKAPIPTDARIMSAVICVEHFETPRFPSGKLEWSVGTGWPDRPVSWASVNPPVYAGQNNKGMVTCDFTSCVNTPDRVNSLQLQIRNNCAAAPTETFVDCVYLVVQWQ